MPLPSENPWLRRRARQAKQEARRRELEKRKRRLQIFPSAQAAKNYKEQG